MMTKVVSTFFEFEEKFHTDFYIESTSDSENHKELFIKIKMASRV